MQAPAGLGGRVVFGLVLFASLTAAILTRGPKWLGDFDQSFYITIAYDIIHHGVFSNGVFDKVDSTQSKPPPGRFFGPVYPAFVAGMMKLDLRFARAANCMVESQAGRTPGSECQVYAVPIHIAHAVFLAIGVFAIGFAAKILLRNVVAFWIASALATAALLPDADLFSFVMTEALTFCLFSVTALALIGGIKSCSPVTLMAAGAMLGLLVLTRTAYVALLIVIPLLIVAGCRRYGWKRSGTGVVTLALGFAAVVGPWSLRNKLSLDHWGLTEEYGSATLIERFAFNDMTSREWFLSFPYCLPVIGPTVVDAAFGKGEMDRFVYHTARSFFHAGRGARDKFVESHGQLDALMPELLRQEMQKNWWRHLLTSVALGGCGMWGGGVFGLLLVPLFAATMATGRGYQRTLLLIYSAPALVMLALHAAVANHYTRYNLILIGPLSVAGAHLALVVMAAWRTRKVGAVR